jgi:group I intron endonuclease
MPYIYKITSPKNKIYIGSTINIKKRFIDYKTLHCKSQRRLYNSFLKYGVDSHNFELIVECRIEEMYKLECYYGNLFNVLSKSGLNCKLPKEDEKFSSISDETRTKIGKWQIGRKLSEETKMKISISHLKNKNRLGTKHNLKSIEKISGGNHHKSKKIVCTVTNKKWGCIKEAAKEMGYNKWTLTCWLNGRRYNKSTLKYL